LDYVLKASFLNTLNKPVDDVCLNA
jgi:hypothetical protein